MASFLHTAVWLVGPAAVEGSHLFQRVASFLLTIDKQLTWTNTEEFSSLSESGFIPTKPITVEFVLDVPTFSSLSESGFIPTVGSIEGQVWVEGKRSHLFQRVASFLRFIGFRLRPESSVMFSSLSESGFIPTKPKICGV